jgi:chaperone required for assembly of F1-ATPase
MRRFWNEVSWDGEPGAFRVLLDGHPVRLPGGEILKATGEKLARAIAAEWRAVEVGTSDVSYSDMPLTRLAGTAQERIAPDPTSTVDAISKYAETDLLCYRAEGPEALVRRQALGWQPWLNWAALEFDAPLRVTAGVMHIAQPHESLRALRTAVAAQDAAILAALGVAVPVLGSLVLGLALTAGRLDAEAAHTLAMIDETFQEELWGVDAAAAKRRQDIRAEIVLAARFMDLSRSHIR